MENARSALLSIHRRILLVFIMSCVFAVLLVGIFLKYVLEKTALDNWKKSQEFITLEFAPQCDFEIEDSLRHLEFIAKLPVFSELPYVDQIDLSINGIPENIDVEKREFFRELTILHKQFSSLFVMKPNGDLYLIHPFKTQLKMKRYNFADRAYFKEVFRTKRPVFSDSFLGASGNVVVVAIVPVVNKTGGITAYIGGGLYLANLSRLVAKERISLFDAGFIVDRKGYLIAHTDTKRLQEETRKRYVEHSLVSKFLDKGQNDDSKVMVEDCIDPVDGKRYLTSFVPLQAGFGLALARDKASVLSEIYPAAWRIALLASTLILVISAAGMLFARGLLKRLAATEQALWKQTYELGKRVKELNCLYGVSKLSVKPDRPLNEVFQEVVNLMPPSWQYPDIACAKIIFEGHEFTTKNFIETEWKQSAHIMVSGEKSGAVEVYYIEKKPEFDEGPFLKEEKDLIDELGRQLGIIVHRNQAEKDVKEHQELLEEKIEERTNELIEAQEQLIRREKLAVLGQLAGGVGHELRNPLGVISNAVYYLKMVQLDADETVKEYLETISSEVDRSTMIVSDLLDLSYTKAAKRETIDVSELINQSLDRHSPPEVIEVVSEIPSDLSPLYVDSHQTGQVLNNLIPEFCT